MFVDESGDLGLKNKGKSYYIISLVFHDQNYDISEAPYEEFTPNERRSIFTKLFFFAKKCDISYKTFLFEKQQFKDEMKLEARIAREISLFIRDNLSYFQSFDELVLYYDNGQKQLNRILDTVLATEIVDYDVRKVKPSDYRLFQVADLICTLELLNKKMEEGEQLSKSEQYIFHSKRDFKKDFMKKIVEKKFKE